MSWELRRQNFSISMAKYSQDSSETPELPKALVAEVLTHLTTVPKARQARISQGSSSFYMKLGGSSS